MKQPDHPLVECGRDRIPEDNQQRRVARRNDLHRFLHVPRKNRRSPPTPHLSWRCAALSIAARLHLGQFRLLQDLLGDRFVLQSSLANSVLFCFPLLRRVRRLRAWTAARGHARASGITVIPALIPRMVRLVANWVATSGVLRDLAACRGLGKFVRLFPQTDFWSFESQVFMTQHMKLDPLGAFYLLHASVHI